MSEHHYLTNITWTGNTGQGTKTVRGYDREHTIQVEGKPVIPGTSEVSIQGNKVKYNPEELLLSALSACHMLVYLYLCAKANVVVTAYVDKATGTLVETADGGGHFTEAILKPEITIQGEVDADLLNQLQHDANKQCYIASSCNFPVRHQPVYVFE
jgi:organic hydroperoxide reductase OsmC/OhrA